MHEMSLVQGMLDIINEERAKHGNPRVTKVVVQCGALAGVVVDSLLFAWEALTPQTDLEGSELAVEQIPLKVRCGRCGLEFEPEDTHLMLCPECGMEIGHIVLQGKELYIGHLETAEESADE